MNIHMETPYIITCYNVHQIIRSEVCDFIKTARVFDPEFLDDVVVSLALRPLLLGYSVEDDSDLLLPVVVGSVVCAVHNAVEKLQVVGAILRSKEWKTFLCLSPPSLAGQNP